MIDLEECKRLCTGKTPGPWAWDSNNVLCCSTSFELVIGQPANDAFIAYFGTHADSLLDELEALRTLAENCETYFQVEQCRDCNTTGIDAALSAWRSLKTEGEGTK